MTFKIIWSEFAETQLETIYAYYEKKASRRIAKKLMNDIINEPNRLIVFGVKEIRELKAKGFAQNSLHERFPACRTV